MKGRRRHSEGSLSQTQRDSLRDSRKRDKKTLYLIYQGLDDDAFKSKVGERNIVEASNLI